jgi:hypothetical protein
MSVIWNPVAHFTPSLDLSAMRRVRETLMLASIFRARLSAFSASIFHELIRPMALAASFQKTETNTLNPR